MIRTILTENFKLDKNYDVMISFIETNLKSDTKYIYCLKEFVSTRLDLNSCVAYGFKQCYDQDIKLEEVFKIVPVDIKDIFEALKNSKNLNDKLRHEEAEDLRKMFLAMCEDLRVVIIRLISIKYDLINLETPLDTKGYNFVNEVKEIFAPLAERLGLNVLKSELEDLCLNFLEPKIFKELESNVMLKHEENEKQIEITKLKLEEILKDLNIKGEIMFRQKHFSSVYKKMKNNHVTLAQIYDLVAMRVLVSTVEDCYAVLGRIHGIYRPMPGRVKDYIASPKENGYRSLHTTIIVENQRPLEVQIRTFEMHKVSEYGVAAHWIYKEKRAKTTVLDTKLSWVREIMEGAKNLSSDEFVETLKTNLYGGIIFVQTPKGKIIEFPEGASIIDFAYAIHSDVGNSCVGGKINSKIQPITTALSNGDVVEVLTSANSKGPSRDWLKVVKTAQARSKINVFFKKELKEENIKSGKTMFDQTLKAKVLNPKEVFCEKYQEELMYKYAMQSLDEFYAAIGYGSLTTNQVIGTLLNYFNRDREEKRENSEDKPIVIKESKNGILVDGSSGLLIRYAKCCAPVVGDEIVGYISRGRGVTIHRADCRNVQYLEEERLAKATFETLTEKDVKVNLRIVTDGKSETITRILDAFSEFKVEIKSFDAKASVEGMLVSAKIVIGKKGSLKDIMDCLSLKAGVIKVLRKE